MKVNIGIVDDKLINRQTVKDKLSSYNEVSLMLEATNGNDFLEQLKLTKILPDIVLMDLEMPELNGIQTIQLATANYPEIKFIVLTVFEDNDKIFEAIKAGAHGYLLKEDTALNIVDAIISVYEHNAVPMSPAIARKAMTMLMQMETSPTKSENELTVNDSHQLSTREMDILRELASGKNYKFIGEKLFISPQTVRKHVANIYHKLHVNSRTQVINIAQKNNWI